MANLPRTCKPAHDWSYQDLLSYNIHVQPLSFSQFFNELTINNLPTLPSTLPLQPFLTTPIPKKVTPWFLEHITGLTHQLFSIWGCLQPLNMGIDADLETFILNLLQNMGPPYSDPGYTNWQSPRLTFQVQGKKYPLTYADISGSPNTEMDMITFLGTLERFVGMDTLPLGADNDGSFDDLYWEDKHVNTWPRDDAEVKLVVTSIAAYNYNNYIAPKKYKPFPWDNPEEISSFFRVQDPLFIPGMAWKGTHPSFYKILIGRNLVKAVNKGW